MDDADTPKVRILDDFSVEIRGEDHTLINPLRMAIASNWRGERVEFCGYNVPHPSDDLVHLSVQFEDESVQSTAALLRKISEGLDCIEACCSALLGQLESL